MSQAFRLHRVSWGEGRFPGVGRATREFWVGGGDGEVQEGREGKGFFFGGGDHYQFSVDFGFLFR